MKVSSYSCRINESLMCNDLQFIHVEAALILWSMFVVGIEGSGGVAVSAQFSGHHNPCSKWWQLHCFCHRVGFQ